MSLIEVKNLTFSYGAERVFENVSFNVDSDWKLGLVGRNGRGKTTFLKLLTGKYEYSGKIYANEKFVYFPFEVNNCDRPVYEITEQICPQAEQWEVIRELSLLNASAELLYRPFCTLSYGERTKVLLAGLFLTEGVVPLIDEPTNHLDIYARRTVAAYLKQKKGFIVVSHDRAFLDGCTDHILAINKNGVEVQSGNFSQWFENFGRAQAFEAARNEKLEKEILRLKKTASRTAVWADKTEDSKNGKGSSGLKADKGYVGHKAAKLMKRAVAAKERTLLAAEERKGLLKNTEEIENFKLYPLDYRADRLLSFAGTEIFYGNVKVCGPLNFEILRGERVALNGVNGSGKSSVFKLITGNISGATGVFKVGAGLKISYVPQTAEGLCGRISDLAAEAGIEESLFNAVLSKLGFGGDLSGDISSFSAGQKKKVLLVKSLLESAHLYVWDEPLNYIDLYSRIQIENMIKEYKPTMLFVEHDEAFRNSVATKIIEL